MNFPILEDRLLALLKSGVKRTTDLIAGATDFHGGPLRIEYMLTADLAREFMEHNVPVTVEGLYRDLLNTLTQQNKKERRQNTYARRKKNLGTTRADLVLGNELTPCAIIEVKIGTRKLNGVTTDLTKIANIIRLMNARYAAKIVGAAVFQVHLAAKHSRSTKAQFRAAARKLKTQMVSQLRDVGKSNPDFQYRLHPLQSADAGIFEQEIEEENGEKVMGRDGHVTQYYVVLIRSTRAVPKPTFELQNKKQKARKRIE
jgi:hypothetical protein